MNYFCEFVPVTEDIKIFSTPDGYYNRDPFLAVIGVTYTGDTEVILRSAEGHLSKRIIFAVAAKLVDKGIYTICVHRRKGRKMPYGKWLKRCGNEDLFEVDLLALREKGII